MPLNTPSYLITTAIDYVNGQPHLGHAYEKILADVIARYKRLSGREVFFLTGVDEHGQKVQQSAQKQGVPPQEFCDRVQADFRALADSLGITYNRWVRTTAPNHKDIVRSFLQKLYDQGDLYLQEYEGFYSVRQEQFVTEKDQVDGQWPEIFGDVVPFKEPNYYFRLSKYQGWLKQHILDNEKFIVPSFRRNDVLNALERPLNDLCISRPRSRLEWGIPLPLDEGYVTYVWFDALVNYVSFARGTDAEGNAFDHWPADVHVIGKDILVPPHGVYWPIMLHALGLEAPGTLLVHGWWLNSGAKMSKSKGNVVDPKPYIETFGPDALRYFVTREMVIGQDADFSDQRFVDLYNSELLKQLGNLVQRVVSMINSYREGVVPGYDSSAPSVPEAPLRSNHLLDSYRAALDTYQVNVALQEAWKLVHAGNLYIEETQPFKLKAPEEFGRRDVILAHLAETLRRISILISPVLPTTAAKIRARLNLSDVPFTLEDALFGTSLANHTIGKPEILFQQIELADGVPQIVEAKKKVKA
ncbi:MAG TPA: class I tRNA ligase family protein [Candidatus Methylacidiphilales bacterium]|nr:class I tRNA ligase family protein [Candidatus Methylacidiphilales bacterium]